MKEKMEEILVGQNQALILMLIPVISIKTTINGWLEEK
jgi:hypothetical protein